MHNILEYINNRTIDFEKKLVKKIRKEKCQYFTPMNIAKFMADIFHYNGKKVTILDPCGGTGILSIAILNKLLDEKIVHNVVIDIYEIDSELINLLKKNIKLLETQYLQSNINLKVTIYNENFIIGTNNKEFFYDFIICNPPYKKISKTSVESKILKDMVFGQPNLYMLFMAQSAKLLSENGQMVFIVPRSFFNGKYFSKFRIFIYNYYHIEYIHSFESRSKIMNNEILQELIIIKIGKSRTKNIKITHSQNDKDLKKSTSLIVENSILWDKNVSRNIRLPISKRDINLIKRFDNLSITFEKLGLKFSTGPVVNFRVKKGLLHSKTEWAVPLIWCVNFGNTYLKWPIVNKKYEQYIEYTLNNKILLPMTSYIIIKRFSSKEEGKNLKINVILNDQLKYSYIGFENHINYLRLEGNTEKIMKGIYILLNSTLYNDYFRILNGTTQINSSDLNTLPCPDLEKLYEISMLDIPFEELVSTKCDEILKRVM